MTQSEKKLRTSPHFFVKRPIPVSIVKSHRLIETKNTIKPNRFRNKFNGWTEIKNEPKDVVVDCFRQCPAQKTIISYTLME